jgi:hypothetical protein
MSRELRFLLGSRRGKTEEVELVGEALSVKATGTAGRVKVAVVCGLEPPRVN